MSQIRPQRPPYQKGQKPLVSKPLRQHAAGQTCTLREPGVCIGGTETVVFCHIRKPGFAGMGQKPHDLLGYYGCAACHAYEEAGNAGDGEILRALMETLVRREAAGLIEVRAAPRDC